jgi:hypothetical protein
MAVFTGRFSRLWIFEVGTVYASSVIGVYRSVGKINAGGGFFFMALGATVNLVYLYLMRNLADINVAAAAGHPSVY